MWRCPNRLWLRALMGTVFGLAMVACWWVPLRLGPKA